MFCLTNLEIEFLLFGHSTQYLGRYSAGDHVHIAEIWIGGASLIREQAPPAK